MAYGTPYPPFCFPDPPLCYTYVMRWLLVLPQTPFRQGHIYGYVRAAVLPLGLAMLGSMLEGEGHEVDLCDTQLPDHDRDRLKRLLARADAVGVSVTTLTAQDAYQVINLCRSARPEVPLVIGGPHPTALGEKVLRECCADVAVFHEGEETILNLTRALSRGDDLTYVRGIAFRHNGNIIRTEPQPFIEDLDTLPFPARHLFPVKEYHPHAGMYRRLPFANMITSRGCPYNCIYCNHTMWGKRVRRRSPRLIFEEIKHLVNTYGVREIAFYDDTFTLVKDDVMELCRMLVENGTLVDWRCSSRVDRVDEELLRAMKEAGCYSIGFGVESGSAELLKTINKEITKDDSRRAFHLSRKMGIAAYAYFMLNLPGETHETIKQTIAFAKELKPAVAAFSIATPMIGTEFRTMIEADDRYRIVEEKWNDYGAFGDNDVLFTQPRLSEGEIKKAYRKAIRSFYLRPSYFLKTIMRIRTWEQVKGYLRGFMAVILAR